MEKSTAIEGFRDPPKRWYLTFATVQIPVPKCRQDMAGVHHEASSLLPWRHQSVAGKSTPDFKDFLLRHLSPAAIRQRTSLVDSSLASAAFQTWGSERRQLPVPQHCATSQPALQLQPDTKRESTSLPKRRLLRHFCSEGLTPSGGDSGLAIRFCS